jgi:putative endonuclease
MKKPAIYILTNKINGTLYTGVTSNLVQRIHQHRNNIMKGFTFIYNCKLLIYYELFDEMPNAIAREKQIKAGCRMKKLMLIESMNPNWNDLYEKICT